MARPGCQTSLNWKLFPSSFACGSGRGVALSVGGDGRGWIAATGGLGSMATFSAGPIGDKGGAGSGRAEAVSGAGGAGVAGSLGIGVGFIAGAGSAAAFGKLIDTDGSGRSGAVATGFGGGGAGFISGSETGNGTGTIGCDSRGIGEAGGRLGVRPRWRSGRDRGGGGRRFRLYIGERQITGDGDRNRIDERRGLAGGEPSDLGQDAVHCADAPELLIGQTSPRRQTANIYPSFAAVPS